MSQSEYFSTLHPVSRVDMSLRSTLNSRRHFLAASLSLSVAVVLWQRQAAAQSHPNTTAALRKAHERELERYHRYAAYSRKAQAEGYRGIAYLFSAFAASELIHAQNFAKILSHLGVEVDAGAKLSESVGSTRKNLLAAAQGELDDIDAFYPAVIKQLQADDHEDAIATARYARESEKQHRAIIKDIQRWSDDYFEDVAKTIDARTGYYFICQVCGSTRIELPARCPICRSPGERYRKIAPPA